MGDDGATNHLHQHRQPQTAQARVLDDLEAKFGLNWTILGPKSQLEQSPKFRTSLRALAYCPIKTFILTRVLLWNISQPVSASHISVFSSPPPPQGVI